MLEAIFRLALTARPQVLSVGESVKGLLGYGQEDFLSGRVSLAERVHAHDAESFARLFCLKPTTDCEPINIRLRQANGRIRCVLGPCSRETAADGKSILILTLHDSKGLMPDLNSSMILSSILESVDECVYFKDRNHVITRANRKYCQRLSNAEGLPRELAGLTDYDLFPEEFADRSYRA